MPPRNTLATLGWLQYLSDPTWPYFEYFYLKYLQKTLTTDWPIIQGGVNHEALQKWLDMCNLLELDRKANLGLMLLAQSGAPG